MSPKTLRHFKDPAISLTTERSAPQRTRVLACAVSLLMLAPATTFALELGEPTMRSGIGQSLLVQIPYRLAPNEQLTPACVGLAPTARLDGAFPPYARVSRIAITPTHIEIFGNDRVLEPLIGLMVDVHCNTAPRFVRSYELFVDLPARTPSLLSNAPQLAAAQQRNESTTSATASDSAASIETPSAPRASVSARARGQAGETLAQGQTYVVVRGDTLSGIAARVGDRPATIRDAAEAIFATNTAAFARGNRDLLEAGRSITIPIMTAVAATQPSAPAPLPSVREADLPPAALLPSVEAPAAAASETPAPRAEATAGAEVQEVVELSTAAVTAVLPTNVASAGASPASAGRASMWWLTTLLALGVVIALSAPLLFVRRRKREAVLQEDVKPRSSHPRRLVDPIAGFHVREEPLTCAPSASNVQSSPLNRVPAAAVESGVGVPAEPDPLTLRIGPTDSVDLDVGAPVMGERDDWLENRADAAVPPDPVVTEATLDGAVPAVDVSDPTIDDEQHTLTIVEIDMLRQDYEAEHTQTQAASKALRDALADLKATQAARAASADTATVEMPQQPTAEATETQQTRRLRSSR